MIGSPLPVLAVLALAACHPSPDGAAAARATSSPVPAPSAASAPAVPVAARHVRIESELVDFDYAYPANAGAIPALKRLLDADIERHKARLTASATQGRKDAKEGGFPFHPFGYWVEWRTVTDLPGWLSLSAEVGTYEGGAHPNHGFDTILWDRQANRRRAPADLFTARQALVAAIREPFCRALDSQRQEKRGGDGKLGSGIEEFDDCIDPLDNGTLILGSSNRKAFDRLGILVPPYNAGPYAEGSYEVTLPVTPAVLAAVKPEFRAVFMTARN